MLGTTRSDRIFTRNREDGKGGIRPVLWALCVCGATALCGASAWGAPGAISNATISEDGSQVTFTLEGMNGAAITGFEYGTRAVLRVSSPGFSETTPTLASRTVWTVFNSATGASPATVTLDLAEWVHAGDTNVTLDIDAGAFNDGAYPSAGVSGAPVTNNSTLGYAVPAAAIVSESLTKHTGAFYVDVYACGPAYTGYRSQFGIAAVAVEVTDAGGTGTTVVKTTTQMQLINRIGNYGWQKRWQAFRVGPFDPGNGGDWGPNGAALGMATVVAKAYPRVGDAESVRTTETGHVFLDKDNSYEVRHAVVSPDAGDNATGRIGVGDGGFWAGVDQVTSAAASRPFADIQGAVSACQRGDGTTAGPAHGKASWSVVYLAAGAHLLGDFEYGTRADTRDGPVIVTRLPSAAPETVWLAGSPNSCGIRTNAVWLEGLRILATGESPVLRTQNQMYHPAGPLGDIEYLKIRNCVLVGAGKTDPAYTLWTEGFEKVLVYAIACFNTRSPLAAIRDSSYSDIGGTFATARDNAVFANNDISIDATATTTPADVLRFYGACDNVSFHNNVVRSIANVDSAPFAVGEGQPVSSFAMTMNVQESDTLPTASRVGDLACKSWYLYHNVWGDGLEYRADKAAFSQENVWVMRNVFADLSLVNAPAVRPTGHLQNHNVNPMGFLGGLDWSMGADLTALFVDWAGGDYSPLGMSLFNRWDDALAPYDAAGQPMPLDGTGAIGALQNVGIVVVDTEAPDPGTLTQLPPYVRSGPVTLAWSGASDEGSGLAEVQLWVKKSSGAWQPTSLRSVGAEGTFTYDGFSGDGTYAFGLRATDAAGNVSPVPGGTGSAVTIFDATPPAGGAITVAPYAVSSPVSLSFAGVQDSASGVESVTLYVKKDGGEWTSTGLSASAGSGSFSYAYGSGDGVYAFALRARDRAGNESSLPAGVGLASTLVDTTPPVVVADLAAPAYIQGGPLELSYSGIQEAGSGLAKVELWVRVGAGAWQATGISSTAASGTLTYNGFAGDGDYRFALRATDIVGNASPVPAGEGFARTTLDSTAPTGGIITVAPYSSTSPVSVSYAGVSDAGSGLDRVALYVKKEGGSWVPTGLTATAEAGSFSFSPSEDGTYRFALVATDRAGSSSPAPAGDGLAATIYDTSAPNPGVASAPRNVNKLPFAVNYSGVQDAGSGIKQVILWKRELKGTTWTDTGLRSTVWPNGRFELDNVSRDAKYVFFVQAEDKAGIKSPAPDEVVVTSP